MLVKRYHAKDMQQAMETIIKELGSDAIVLNSRKVRKKGLQYFFSKPVLEVMVAYDPEKIPSKRQAFAGGAYGSNGARSKAGEDGGVQLELSRAARHAQGANGQGRCDDGVQSAQNAQQIAGLDKRLSALDSLLTDFFNRFSYVKREVTYDFSPPVEVLLEAMVNSQVKEDLALSLAKETEVILRRQKDTTAREVLEHLMLEMLGEPEPVQLKKFHQKVILFVGPTGVGKTTSLVKLASRFVLGEKKRVGIINTDTYRIAAQEQLRTYAEILSIPLEVVYQLDEMKDAMEAMSDREIILIDTAGKRPGDEQHRQDIEKIMALAAPEDILLCVAATTAFASIQDIVDTYGFMESYKLLVTKMDETKHRGMILSLSWYAKRSIAYMTTGQNVPDDIEVADMEKVVNATLG